MEYYGKRDANLGLQRLVMIGGLAEATPYLIVLVGCGVVWFVVSRYKSIHDVPRKQLALLGLGWLVLVYLFILAVSQ